MPVHPYNIIINLVKRKVQTNFSKVHTKSAWGQCGIILGPWFVSYRKVPYSKGELINRKTVKDRLMVEIKVSRPDGFDP